MIKTLSMTVGVVLEYLKDARVLYISENIKLLCCVFFFVENSFMLVLFFIQEHGENKGNDLLASVRVIGRYR